jgi:hypothetical protein
MQLELNSDIIELNSNSTIQLNKNKIQIGRENIENLFVNMVLGKKTFKRHKFKSTHFHASSLWDGLPISILTY